MNKIIYNLTKLKSIDVTNNMPSLIPVPMLTKKKSIFSKLKIMLSDRKWKLYNDFVLKINDDLCILVPKDFMTNFASIPRLIWPILSPDGPLLIASIIHDFLYTTNGIIVIENKEFIFYKMTKSEADCVLKLITEKVNDMNIVAFIAEKAVNYGGYFAWKKCRRNNETVKDYFPHITKIK